MKKSALISIALVALAAWVGYTYGTRSGSHAPPTAAGSTTDTLAAAKHTAATAAALRKPGVGTGQVIVVKPGESIQDAVHKAQPGDTVQVMPGTYSETVYIDKDNIALVGVIHGGDWPTLDGERKRNDAVLYSGNGIRIENLITANRQPYDHVGKLAARDLHRA